VTLTYDNYDFLDTVKDQTLGSTQQMTHFATAHAVINRYAPPQGLTQDMLRRTSPLPMRDIVLSFIRIKDNIHEDIWVKQLLFRAIDHGVGEEFKHWRTTHDIPWPVANDKVLPPEPQELIYLSGMPLDTGTIEGTANVHYMMMERELGIKTEDNEEELTKRLYLIHGDQKSVELSRSVRAEQVDSIDAFERRNWMLPIPALFHVQMNMASALLQFFWQPKDKEGPGKYTQHSFLTDVSFLGLKGISLERAPWHDLDMLIRTSFDARMLAMFLQCGEELGLATRRMHKTPDGMRQFIQDMQPEDFDRILNLVDTRLFSAAAYEGTDETGTPCLPHMTTLARFMQSMFWYIILRHSIRYGDLDTISKLYPHLAIFFLGTGKHKYGREMLYLNWLLSDQVSDRVLQDAIRYSMVVNVSGRKDSFLPTDRMQEHINGSIRNDQKTRKNSTHDSHVTFGKWLRIVPPLADIRKIIQKALGVELSGTHSTKSTSLGVAGIACRLWEDDWMSHATKHPNQATAEDIMTLGLERLRPAIESFNCDVVDLPDNTMVVSPEQREGVQEAWRVRGIDDENDADVNKTDAGGVVIERPCTEDETSIDLDAW